MSELALQYGSTREAINQANGLNAANLIFIGQRLIIPINLPAESGGGELVSPSSTPTATPTFTPTFTPTLTPTVTPTPTATPITYQVLRGDTLGQIAQRYGTTAQLLAQLNNIPNIHQLDVGQILVIPTAIPPSATPTLIPTAAPAIISTADAYIIYVVQDGDTLSQIAVDHDTTVAAIAQLNGIANPRTIFVGQRLRIPSAVGTPVEPAQRPAAGGHDANCTADAHAAAHRGASHAYGAARRHALRDRRALRRKPRGAGAAQQHHQL